MQAYSDVWLNCRISGACLQRTFLSPAGANSRDWNVTPALYAATETKTVLTAKENKSLQFRRRLRDFIAPVLGLPLVAVYVPVHDKIRSEDFAVAANISRRSGGDIRWFRVTVHAKIILAVCYSYTNRFIRQAGSIGIFWTGTCNSV
jgi:hypothetical protein